MIVRSAFGRWIDRINTDRRIVATPGRPRLIIEGSHPIYAIGDVHGRLDLLRKIDTRIQSETAQTGRSATIIMMGDYVDRGPDSAGVIEHLLRAPPSGLERLCLAGNHEEMFLAALDNQGACRDWLGYGGLETLESYGVPATKIWSLRRDWPRLRRTILSRIPQEHLQFMSKLPVAISVRNTVFVHAGLVAGRALDSHTDGELMWHRRPLDLGSDMDRLVVHGHTIVNDPYVSAGEINIDTGAYASGVLTAVCLQAGVPPRLVQVDDK
jgi:serine/threonine protein phosphatase 1